MSTIKYISLSDLHFGEEDSLLTNLKPGCDEVDPTEASPVLKALMECLKNLVNDYNKGAKPTLILNGDVLELALAKTEEAGMVFQRFLEGVMAPGAELFSEIFCLPGNHDHHLWEMAREAQYSGFLQRHSAQFIGKPIPRPWHTTKLFCEGEAHPVHSALLDAFVTTSNPPGAVNIQIAYPNLGLLSKNGKRCVVFHHGHFTEDIYWMTSKVKRWIFNEAGEPFHVWDLEKENFAWIDFVWSVLGRSDVGLETIYEKLSDPSGNAKFIDYLAKKLAGEIGWNWTDFVEKAVFEKIMNWAYNKFTKPEKLRIEEELTRESAKTLYEYVEKQLWRQLKDNLAARALKVDELPRNIDFDTNTKDVVVPETTFVYGHTHKPFSRFMTFTGYPGWVNVYNTGGWIVETIKPAPTHGGAIMLVDDQLNTAAIRVYNEQNQGGVVTPPRVEEARPELATINPLFTGMTKWLKQQNAHWRGLTACIGEAVGKRRAHLERRIVKRM